MPSAARLSRSLFALCVIAGLTSWIIGCKPDAAVKDPALIGRGTRDAMPPRSAAEPKSQAGTVQIVANGSISGSILFNGKVPTNTIDTSMDPACAMDGGKSRLPVEQYVAKDGRLANVYIYLKSGPDDAMMGGNVTARPVVMDQIHCQYVPHVVAVEAGGYVEFRNSDPTMHNVHVTPTQVGNETIDISEGPRGEPQLKQFIKPELMVPVRCNNHPWMNAFINVSATPYFAVSDSDGHFELRGLPPGDYVIGAVHEKIGEKTMHVTVRSNETTSVEFGFTQ
jgi:plastocyanin